MIELKKHCRKILLFALFFMIIGCTLFNRNGENIGINALISECGGFDTGQKELGNEIIDEIQCSNERLIWDCFEYSI